MPIIRIEMFPGRTLAQKRELVRLITDAVCNVAHTDPKSVARSQITGFPGHRYSRNAVLH